MKINNNYEDKQSVVIGKTNETVSFGITNNAAFLHNLSDTLYSDKLLAALREPICNAWDAHTDAGIPNTSIQVDFIDNVVHIRDFGKGIPTDEFYEIYGTFGGSTKQNDLNATGGFGLGCKAPLAYVDSFTVTNIYNGTKSIYSITKYSEIGGKPAINLIMSMDTDEPSGITVSIPCSDNQSEFVNSTSIYEYIIKIATGSEQLIKYNGEVLDVNKYIKYDDNDIAFVVDPNTSSHYRDAKIFILHHNVQYPLDSSKIIKEGLIEGYSTFYSKWKEFLALCGMQVSILIKVPKNSIAMTPSRESLSYTSETIETISKYSSKLNDSFNSFLKGLYDECINPIWSQMYKQYYHCSPYFRHILSNVNNNIHEIATLLANKANREIKKINITEVTKSFFNYAEELDYPLIYLILLEDFLGNDFLSSYGAYAPYVNLEGVYPEIPNKDFDKALTDKYAPFFKLGVDSRVTILTPSASTCYGYNMHIRTYLKDKEKAKSLSASCIHTKVVVITRTKAFFNKFHKTRNHIYSGLVTGDNIVPDFSNYMEKEKNGDNRIELLSHTLLMTLTKKMYKEKIDEIKKELALNDYLVIDIFDEQEKYEKEKSNLIKSVSSSNTPKVTTLKSNSTSSFLGVNEEFQVNPTLTPSRISPPILEPVFIMLWSPRTLPFHDGSTSDNRILSRVISEHLESIGKDAIVVTSEKRYEDAMETYNLPDITEYFPKEILSGYFTKYALKDTVFDSVFLDSLSGSNIYRFINRLEGSYPYTYFLDSAHSLAANLAKGAKRLFESMLKINESHDVLNEDVLSFMSDTTNTLEGLTTVYNYSNNRAEFEAVGSFLRCNFNKEAENYLGEFLLEWSRKYYDKYCPILGGIYLLRTSFSLDLDSTYYSDSYLLNSYSYFIDPINTEEGSREERSYVGIQESFYPVILNNFQSMVRKIIETINSKEEN